MSGEKRAASAGNATAASSAMVAEITDIISIKYINELYK
jgi:hypothetical protein